MSDTKYLVAARKYRPQLFGDVVAQEHVTETLKNAIKMDRLAHAYLFSGPRGVGKTTIARILAKAINCEVPLEDRPEAEPCEKCTSCTSFNEGRSLNVIEIDAASNNKVDDVRELRDTVRIPPQGARKKVYIVDEVHMLSNAAFNAFLKTLEEPPPYALFIFATTEPRKVIPTILSRCQRFDFKRIPVAEISSRLSEIADQESISVDEASLMLIAQKGDGALRDALSVFDQAVSLCGTSITYAELAQALRVADQELFFAATTNIADGNSSGMLDLIDKITSEGYDLQEFLAGLAGHIRNLLVAVSTGQTTLIEATEAMQAQYMDHSKTFSEQQLLRLLVILSQTEESVGRSTQPRLAAELGLLKMASSMNAVDLRKALARVEQLEKKVKSANTLAQATPRSSGDSVSEAIKAAPDREKAPEPIEIKPISRKIKEHKQAPPASDEPAVEQVASEPAQKAGTKQSPSEQKKTEPKVSTPDPAEETSAPVVPSGPCLARPHYKRNPGAHMLTRLKPESLRDHLRLLPARHSECPIRLSRSG